MNLKYDTFPVKFPNGKITFHTVEEILAAPALRSLIKKDYNKETAYAVMEYLVYYNQQ